MPNVVLWKLPTCSFRQERNIDLQVCAPSGVALRFYAESGQDVRLAQRPQACVPCRWRKNFLGSRLFKPIVLGVQAGSLRSLDFGR
jgi:hypothetical protein